MPSERAVRRTPTHDSDRPPQATTPYRAIDSSVQSNDLERPEPGVTSSSTGHMVLLSRSPQAAVPAREMTPPESSGSVRYTKTGRVSKANKGQRVHTCNECGKVYTRAEHLRRHQQNHKPPGAFPCDVPGCNRSFFREDLLLRHKARHDDPSSGPSPPPPDSPGSQTSAPDGQQGMEHSLYAPSTVPIATTLSITGPPLSANDSHGTASQGKFSTDVNPFWRHRDDAEAVCTGSMSSYGSLSMSGVLPGGGSPTSAYGSPTEFGPWPYVQHPSVHNTESSYLGGYPLMQTSRSPVSDASSTTYIPQLVWEGQDHGLGPQESAGTFTLPLGHAVSSHVISPKVELALDAFDLAQTRAIRGREQTEARWLALPTAAPDICLGDPHCTDEQRYLGAYFTHIHHFYPVVHKPSFQAESASSLLRSAMFALGAQALPNKQDKTNARLIHERCIAVLKERTSKGTHTFHVDDLQAILLVEVYSIFKSRRPPRSLSQPFESIYCALASDPEASNPSASDVSPYPSDAGLSGNDTFQHPSVRARCKHRLLLACYILDQQHATFFGRPRQCRLTSSATDLEFPAPQSLWDDKRRDSARVMPHSLQNAFNFSQLNAMQEYDCFQSMLVMAIFMDESLNPAGVSPYGLEALRMCLSPREKQVRCELAYHTLILCKSTPVRELLAVAGESWVMPEKLNDPRDFARAQMTSHEWACGQDETKGVHVAIGHALHILKIHYHHPTTGLLFQEWSIFLAATVAWAHAYATAGFSHRDPSMPSAMPNSVPIHDPDDAILDVITRVERSEGRIGMEQARAVLLWTRAKIEKVDLPHNCGVTNGALDVLGRLISRGDETGWFGV